MDTAAAAPLETVPVNATRPEHSHFWASDSFSFHDLLDAINPLQHLPVIGTIYRKLTGDTIGNVARVVGDGLYGGPLGALSGLADVASIEITGKDIGQNLLSLVDGDDDKKDAPPAATPAAPAAPAASAPDTAPMAQTAPAGPTADPAPAAATSAAASTAGLKPLSTAAHAFAIDTSPAGLMAIKANSAMHSQPAVPLSLPPGTQLSNQGRAPSAATPMDFASRMQDGLDKYSALLAARGRATPASGSTVDQIH